MTTSNQNLEVEIKLQLADNRIVAVLQKIMQLGFALKEKESLEYNIVFDTPDKSLKQKHQLLRLRQKDDHLVLTFKRPLTSLQDRGEYKIREEIEVNVSDFEKAKTIIMGLGYEISFIYEKYRQVFEGENQGGTVEIMIDRTPIGTYIEIEGTPPQIDDIAAKLGFEKKDYITDNYRTLFLKTNKTGFMQFS